MKKKVWTATLPFLQGNFFAQGCGSKAALLKRLCKDDPIWRMNKDKVRFVKINKFEKAKQKVKSYYLQGLVIFYKVSPPIPRESL